jgi:hypothetical protein
LKCSRILIHRFAMKPWAPLVRFPSSVSDFIISSVSPWFDFLFPVELIKVIESAMPHILEVLKDTDLWVRISASTTLGEIFKQSKWFHHLLSWVWPFISWFIFFSGTHQSNKEPSTTPSWDAQGCQLKCS